jgi:hypothetical protein
MVNLTNNNDTEFLGNGDDEVYVLFGDDFISAGGGNDTIYGGIGNDTILPGPASTSSRAAITSIRCSTETPCPELSSISIKISVTR